MNRRHFIRNLSLLSASLGTGILPTLSLATPIDARLEKHTALLQTAVNALLPTDNYSKIVAAEKVPVAQNVLAIMSNLDDKAIEELSLALTLFNNASYILGLNFKPFEELSTEQAQNYIASWEQGFQTQKVIAITLKKLVYMGYWGDEKSWSTVPSFETLTNREIPPLGVTEFKG